jgi:hypothetical protein
MNKRGFELAISTIVVIVIGMLVLVALILATRGAFESLESTSTAFGNTAQVAAIKEACNIACSTNDRLTYCCEDFETQDETIRCTDDRLEASCNLDCSAFSCSN